MKKSSEHWPCIGDRTAAPSGQYKRRQMNQIHRPIQALASPLWATGSDVTGTLLASCLRHTSRGWRSSTEGGGAILIRLGLQVQCLPSSSLKGSVSLLCINVIFVRQHMFTNFIIRVRGHYIQQFIQSLDFTCNVM